MELFYLLLLVFVAIISFSLHPLYLERFAPGSIASIGGLPSGQEGKCSSHCNLKDPTTGLPADPQDCCECLTSNGVLYGPRDSENIPLRKCMCNWGPGFEDYCYEMKTNFLLSQ